MTRIRMLDGSYCYTAPGCRKHTDAIREMHISSMEAKLRSREEKEFVARRQWHPTLNNISYDDAKVADSASWWKCPVADDHVWQASKFKRTSRGDGCPYCSGHRPSSTNNLTLRPDLAAELLSDEAGVLSSEIALGSNKPLPWMCAKGHRWTATPNTRQTRGCAVCAKKHYAKYSAYEHTLLGKYPQLAAEFDEKANGIPVEEASSAEQLVYWWTCPKGHKTRRSVQNRIRGNFSCTKCNGRVADATTSLAALHPEIALELDVANSTISAEQLVPGSGKVVPWICSVNPKHRWSAAVRNRTGRNQFHVKFGCPECTKAHTSNVEQKFKSLFSSLIDTRMQDQSSNQKLPIPWRKNKRMSVDIYGDYHGTKVAIEYDGFWYHRAEEDYRRDRDKTEALIVNGYRVVRIREGQLESIELENPNLLQLNYRYTMQENAMLEIVDQVNDWLMKSR